MIQYIFTQDTISKAVTDFLHYTWIFEDAGEGEQEDKNVGENSSGTISPIMPHTSV